LVNELPVKDKIVQCNIFLDKGRCLLIISINSTAPWKNETHRRMLTWNRKKLQNK